MKRLLSILIKLGILAAIVYAAVATNPGPDRHKSAIAAKMASLREEDILGQTQRMMYHVEQTDASDTPYAYHNYFVCSKVTGPEGDMASFGFFNRVFVTKTEL